MKPPLLSAGLLLLLSFVVGCSSSPVSRYPDFLERKKAFSSSIILADCVVIDALPGDTAKVDLPLNRKLAKNAVYSLAGLLNQKGYHVDRTLLSSIGLLMDADRTYKIVRAPEDQQRDPAALDTASPPFYVDSLFLRNEVLEGLLRIVTSSLINTVKQGHGPDPVIPGAAGLGKALGGGELIVLLIGGYNVPVAEQVRRFTPSPPAAQKKITFQRASQCTVRLYMLDSSTGELVWDDETHLSGGIVHEQKILDLITALAEDLP